MTTDEIEALLASERRGRVLAAELLPAAHAHDVRLWRADARPDPMGQAVLAASRWAARFGVQVEAAVSPEPGGAAWTALAESSRRQGFAVSGRASASRVRLIDGGGRERDVRDLPDSAAAWRTLLSATPAMVGPAGPETAAMSRARCRNVDRIAIERFGVPGLCLMENAAVAAVSVLLDMPAAGPVLIAAGGGNNGGDGLAVARGLRAIGVEATVAMLKDPGALSGDAEANYRLLSKKGGGAIRDIHNTPEELAALARDHGIIVDALLGTGFSGGLSPHLRAAVEAINASGQPVLALDIPSGLDSDTGEVAGIAVKANRTITFAAVKTGLLAGKGPEYCGELFWGDIGAPSAALA